MANPGESRNDKSRGDGDPALDLYGYCCFCYAQFEDEEEFHAHMLTHQNEPRSKPTYPNGVPQYNTPTLWEEEQY